MKNFSLLLRLACVAALVFVSACSPSTQTQINSGGTITNGGDFTYLFAGSASHIFRSSDKGASWVQTTINGQYSSGLAFATHGPYVFATSLGHGILRSTDSGATWNTLNAGTRISGIISLVVVNDVLIAGTQSGVLRSTDDGATWAVSDSANLAGKTSDIRGLVAIGNSIVMVPEFGTSVYCSTDIGMTWHPISVELASVIVKLALATNGTDLFLATTDSGAYRSTDGGSTWSALRNGSPMQLSTIAASGDNVYVGTPSKGFYRSTDRGDTWQGPYNNSRADTAVTSLLPRGNYLYSSGNGPGVYESADNGLTWVARNNGLTDTAIVSIGTK